MTGKVEIKTGRVVTGSFEIKKEALKKRVIMKFEGFLVDEQSHEFLKRYDELKRQVDVKNTDLIIDAKGLKPFQAQALDMVSLLYKDYTNFKSIHVVSPDAVLTKSQMKRMFQMQNITDRFKFVNSIYEV